MKYPESLNNLIECFQKLPGVGAKTAERMALAVLEFDSDTANLFSKSITDVKNKIRRCSKCNNFSEDDLCLICQNKERNNKIICVVEEAKNINLFEKIGTFNGVYHVLDGLISPLQNINPEDINLNALFKRIEEENIEEVILAIKPTIEGETTALYISKMLENKNVVISKIAHGIPLGADIDYIDALTLELALQERKKISES